MPPLCPLCKKSFVETVNGKRLEFCSKCSDLIRSNTRPISGLCECSDPGCSCGEQCIEEGIAVLYRVNMEDNIGVRFCVKCAEDAHASGLYRDILDEDMDVWLSDVFDDDDYTYLSDDDLPF